MKNLFKTLFVCVMLAWAGSMTTSCMKDNADEPLGPPALEITGEPIVNNAISVDIPVNAVNLMKLAYMVEEYVEVTKDGVTEALIIEGYDADGEPKFTNPIRKVGDHPNIAVIFRADKKGKGKVYENVRKMQTLPITGNEGLDKNKKFVVSIAATISQTDYLTDINGKPLILTATFETPKKYSDNDVTVIRESFEGMDVSVTVPPSVLKANRRVRWGVTNIATVAYNEKKPVCEMLYLCDFVYPASIIARDTVLNINHHNAYRRNDKGEIGYYVIGNTSVREVSEDSEEVKHGSAEAIQYYYNFTPGEPLVLYLAEADFCSPETGLEPTCLFSFGYDVGWYWFPYDMEAYVEAYWKDPTIDPEQFWHEGAWHREVKLTLPGPSKFAGSVGVNVSDLSTNGGTITFTPDDKTFMYLFGIFEDTDQYGSGFKDITNKYLDGKEELWQWFTTAEMAPNFGISYAYASEGKQVIKLQEYFNSLTAGGKYHIVVNAVGAYTGEDQNLYPDMTSQNFQHIEFELKEYSLPKPVLEVTAAEPYSPWKVKYILKNPNWQTNPISKVSFVANYTREFEAYMKANNFTYTDMAMMNAGLPRYQLKDVDIEMINSPAGAEVEFDVFEKSSFTAAFIAWNSEGNTSNPDSETTPGYATAESLANADADPLDMANILALKGVWTATATVNYLNPETNQFTAKQHSWKVSIGDLTSPETLTDDVYAILEKHGVNKEAADAYFAEFKQEEEIFNNSVKGQNRVLCQGWQLDEERTLSTASPWDLFIMEDYNAAATSSLFYDFGPKWFLQVNENGEVFVPVNYNRIPTFTKWFNGMAHYFCMANYETQDAFLMGDDINSVEQVAMPIEVSEDGNSFTIKSTTIKVYNVDEEGKPIVDDKGEVITKDVQLYPNIIYESMTGYAFYNNHIISDVVLTRGWNDGAAPAPAKASVNSVYSKKVEVKNISAPSTFKQGYNATAFVPKAKKAEVKVSTARQITPEETHKGMAKYFRGRVPARR